MTFSTNGHDEGLTEKDIISKVEDGLNVPDDWMIVSTFCADPENLESALQCHAHSVKVQCGSNLLKAAPVPQTHSVQTHYRKLNGVPVRVIEAFLFRTGKMEHRLDTYGRIKR